MISKYISQSLLGCCFIIISGLAHSKPTAIEQLMAFAKVKTVQADFVQKQNMVDGRMSSMTGRFWMISPEKLRWETMKPYQQLLISDGQKVWFYDQDLNQVTVQSQKQAANDKSLLLLLNPVSAQQYFYLKNVSGSSDQLDWVEAKPKSREISTFSSILIGFSGGKPQKMLMIDAFGQQTIIEFGNLVLNGTIDKGRFVFQAPKGVEVVTD